MSALFSTAWYYAQQAKRAPRLSTPAPLAVPVDRERKLHADITEELNRQRLLFLHSRMDVASTNHEDGPPDFIIFAPRRLIMLECKTRTGKLSEAQFIWHNRARLAGYPVEIVRSFGEVVEVLK